MKYLRLLGHGAMAPELPRGPSEYMPYVFSEDEVIRIISTADNFQTTAARTVVAVQMPLLLRLLCGCGLRLGEALPLTGDDIDLARGVVTVRTAKNNKQRFVPLHFSLTNILTKHCAAMSRDHFDKGLLFLDQQGSPVQQQMVRKVFKGILAQAGIHRKRKERYERGICPHCLRHFVVNNVLWSNLPSQGRIAS